MVVLRLKEHNRQFWLVYLKGSVQELQLVMILLILWSLHALTSRKLPISIKWLMNQHHQGLTYFTWTLSMQRKELDGENLISSTRNLMRIMFKIKLQFLQVLSSFLYIPYRRSKTWVSSRELVQNSQTSTQLIQRVTKLSHQIGSPWTNYSILK